MSKLFKLSAVTVLLLLLPRRSSQQTDQAISNTKTNHDKVKTKLKKEIKAQIKDPKVEDKDMSVD